MKKKSEFNVNVEIKKLGTCPVCGKGEIVKGTLGYSCNHFKSVEDKCSFIIYNSYFKKNITEDIALKLIKDGYTDIYHDFKNKNGDVFSAKLIIEDGFVKPSFSNEILQDVKCPICNEEIQVFMSGYGCNNFIVKKDEGERMCNFFVPKVICEHEITREEVIELATNKHTSIIDDFISTKGVPFVAKLIVNDENVISFDNSICKCPKCLTGNIFFNKAGYFCSNSWEENIKCDFKIWKEIKYRTITPEEVVLLCTDRKIENCEGFLINKERQTRTIMIDEQFDVILI